VTITHPKVTICAPSANEEFEKLKFVLNRLSFYKSNGYVVTLPNNTLLQDPKILEDLDNAFNLFKTSEHDSDFFNKGLETINFERDRVEKFIQKLLFLKDYWDFKIFPEYKIVLTKYGTGGSYNADVGKVVLLIRKEGGSNRDPSQTIIHEIVHIGIEESIVQKFSFYHSEKERLVDLLVKTIFAKEFPNYHIQKLGDSNLDEFINENSIKNLPETIKRYTLAKEINTMAFKDQEYRKTLDKHSPLDKSIDKTNNEGMKEIIKEIGYPTISKVGKEASFNSWLIIQHSPEIDFQIKCLDLMEKESNDINPQNSAYLKDRVLILTGKPQIYGTQLRKNPETGKMELYSVEDLPNLDKRRESIGLGSIESYLKSFI
jgi:hypothetical protein